MLLTLEAARRSLRHVGELQLLFLGRALRRVGPLLKEGTGTLFFLVVILKHDERVKGWIDEIPMI